MHQGECITQVWGNIMRSYLCMNDRGIMKEIITIKITDETGNVQNKKLLSVASCNKTSPVNPTVNYGRQRKLTCKSYDEESLNSIKVFAQENSQIDDSYLKESGSQSYYIKQCRDNRDTIVNENSNNPVVIINCRTNSENNEIQGRHQIQKQNTPKESQNQIDNANECTNNKFSIVKEPNIGEHVDNSVKNIGGNQINGWEQETNAKKICSTKKRVLFVSSCVGFLSIIIIVPCIIFNVLQAEPYQAEKSSTIYNVTSTLFTGTMETLTTSTSQQTANIQKHSQTAIGQIHSETTIQTHSETTIPTHSEITISQINGKMTTGQIHGTTNIIQTPHQKGIAMSMMSTAS